MNETPSLEDIVSALKREYDDAEDYFTATIWPEVETAIKYFEAQAFGDEIPGRSQIVLPDVAEVIGYMEQSVLRNFVSADRVVEIEATIKEDEEGADEATAALDYNFRREQDGYRVLCDWLQSGLLEKIGAIKTVCETEEKVIRERGTVDQMMAAALDSGDHPALQGGELEALDPQPDGSFLATIKRNKIVKRYRDVPIPLNEFRFSRNARHEDDADYLAHVSLKTRSELVEMGFDRDQVDDLPTADNIDLTTRGSSGTWSNDWRDTSELPSELQTVLLCEEYARMDVDGDGIAERVHVFRVENDILTRKVEPAIETIEEHPIVVFTPFSRAHRLVGHSLADKSMDLQRIRSVVARQLMDGMYNANMPRPMIDMSNEYSPTTVEDVLRPIPGAPIRFKGTAPQPYETTFDVGKSISVLEFWTGERETRTGITRMNQGLDADTLNKTATGAALMQAQGQQHEEAVARVFGEAFGRLMAKKMRLMKREKAQFPIKLDTPAKNPETGEPVKYTMVDAANWPDEFNTIVRVGLGTGRKEQVVQNIFALGQFMQQAAEIGAVDKKGVVNLGTKLVRTLQLGQGDDFFVDPTVPDQPQQDPAIVKAQTQAQTDAMKVQAKSQSDQQSAQAKAQMSQYATEMKAQTDRERMAQEAELERERLQQEHDLSVIGMAADMHTKVHIAENKPGGRLDA